MGTFKRALKYGYSNARAKAMESKLIDNPTMKSIADAPDVASVMSVLFQTDYNAAITKFGGLQISTTMFDFAVSENMTEKINQLARISPKEDRDIIRTIIARWDLGNVKIALEALDRKKPFESISMYLTGSSEFGARRVQEAMGAESIDAAFARFMHNRTYRMLISKAYDAYRKSGSIEDAIAAIDIEHYKRLSEAALRLEGMKDSSSRIIMMDIHMRNMITLIRAKRKMLKFADISANLMRNGLLSIQQLSSMYSGSDSIESLASKSPIFNLKDAVEVYRQGGHLYAFEISMRNQIFNASMRMLRASVLSIGALVDYIYLKEIEVFTLRAIVKSKEYGLSKEEVSRLVVWNL